jgi:D-ornithine 4,5-aminomutase subunit alpha
MKREDDFESRRQHLKDLTEAELEKRFWELCEKIVDPLVKLAETHTSPAVERSVLLRMGFSSIDAKSIVDRVTSIGLLGKGAGNVIYRLADQKSMDIKEAGLQFASGKFDDGEVTNLFAGGER